MSIEFHTPVYLDYNSTTPIDSKVLGAMMPTLTDIFGNPSSETHEYGKKAKQLIENSRFQAASLIGASPREIVFTSGATEGCNIAIKGVARAYSNRGRHIIVSAVEHKAVLESCKRLEQEGFLLTILRPDSAGYISEVQVNNAITKETILVCVMMANNIVGTINPIEAIGQICKKRGIIFFCDATQAVGKIPVNVEKCDVDLLAFSSHKIYGPKGAGALYVRGKSPCVKLIPLIDGGGQEYFLRSGTLNVPGIVGLGMACELCRHELEDKISLSSLLRDKLEQRLTEIFADIRIFGNSVKRIPNTSLVAFAGIDVAAMISNIPEIAVSLGSACDSGTSGPNYVLRAMGIEDEFFRSTVRFSIGRFTSEREIDYTTEQIHHYINNRLYLTD